MSLRLQQHCLCAAFAALSLLLVGTSTGNGQATRAADGEAGQAAARGSAAEAGERRAAPSDESEVPGYGHRDEITWPCPARTS